MCIFRNLLFVLAPVGLLMIPASFCFFCFGFISPRYSFRGIKHCMLRNCCGHPCGPPPSPLYTLGGALDKILSAVSAHKGYAVFLVGNKKCFGVFRIMLANEFSFLAFCCSLFLSTLSCLEILYSRSLFPVVW